ncbi:hypothetical protein [Microbacterium sp. R86528]|uniref:hypothetical protein n=1 Tax=Microbacterium sp. R86528 TaxID=3093864 RepID=UPI0037C9A9AB
MPTELNDSLPSHEPAEDALALVVGIGIEAIPIVGGMLGRTFDHALATRDKERRHAFDVSVVAELQRVSQLLNTPVIVETILSSDDFLAALARAQRIASETGSVSKRHRLAACVAEVGPWSKFASAELAQHTLLVERLDDLHVWLLAYIARQGGSVIAGNDLPSDPAPIDYALGSALGINGPAPAVVTDAVEDLQSQLLVSLSASASGVDSITISDRGSRFVDFLRAIDAEQSDPPAI